MKALCRIFSVIILVIIMAACSPFGTDNLPAPSPLAKFTPSLQVKRLWLDDVGGIGEQYFNYTIAPNNDVIYTANKKGLLIATRRTDDARLWRVFMDKTIIGGPSYGNGLIVVSTDEGIVYAFDAKKGVELWQQQLDNQVLGAATITKTSVLVKTVDDGVYALDVKTGKTQWSYVTDAPEMVLRGGSTPVVAGDKVLVGLANGKLIALGLSDGVMLWQQQVTQPQGATDVQRMVDITISPVVSGHVAYVASYQGFIAAYNLDTGAALWHHKISAYAGIAIANNLLFITDAKGDVWAFDKKTGTVVWRQEKLEHRGLTAPVVMGRDIVIADAEGYLHWLNQKTGKFVARVQVAKESAIASTPLVVGNTVYALAKNGTIAAYQAPA
tara:strand:+ start:22245 stop:23396 length:1152 start_codon:yes stop_codon:yes gene_type:complete